MSYKWIVSLNDGQQISSDKLMGDNKNPWTRLLEYLKNNKLNSDGESKKITHISIIVNGVIYNSPSMNLKSNFKSSEGINRPWVFYRSTADLGSTNQTHHMSFSYRCGDYRHFFWVNTENNSVYTQVINVINPSDKNDISFLGTEKDIEDSYLALE